jgi:hypothetical protein
MASIVLKTLYHKCFLAQQRPLHDNDSTRQSVLFSDLAGKTFVAKFDQEHARSDGGAILLQACDRRLGQTYQRHILRFHGRYRDRFCFRAARSAALAAAAS